MYNVICAVAAPIYLAPYVGIAERASTVALEHVKAKRPARHTLPVLGQMQNALLEAQLAWRETVAGGASDAPNEALASRTLSCKTILVRAARACVQHAIDVVGGAALFKAHPLERLWRDVQAAPFHPLPEAQQLVFSGRVALGLSPIEAEEPPL
jgi:acyl-CoA dehydrogenase